MFLMFLQNSQSNMGKSYQPKTLSCLILAICCFQFHGCGTDEVAYMSFLGERLYLTSVESSEIELLFPKGLYDPDSLALLLEAYDKGYRSAVEVSGREPLASAIGTAKLPLAVVPKSCGPGCGRLGQKGIEISKYAFDEIYREFVVNGRHDHLFFYELGRNFWFYGQGRQLGDLDAIHTGFAVFFRDFLVKELDISMARINAVPYSPYLKEKEDRFEKFRSDLGDRELTWTEVQKSKELFFPHAPIFWSSLWWDLYQTKGKQSLKTTLQHLADHPIQGDGEVLFQLLYRKESACTGH
jgi:hypothetical protein